MSSLINVVLSDYVEKAKIREDENKMSKKRIADLWNKVQRAHSLEEVDKIFKEASE